jgi:hypothetical protein
VGRKSTISRLPLPVRKAIDDALKTGKFTLDEILGSIREQFGDEIAPSRSALGRYSARFEEIGAKLRESREVAQVWAERLGKEPEGDVAKLVMELLRTLAFDLTLSLTEGEADVKAGDLNKLALVMQRLEAAGKWNIQREEQMRKAVLDEVDQKIEGVAKGPRKLDADTLRFVREAIRGAT